jgi:hypothetical protein
VPPKKDVFDMSLEEMHAYMRLVGWKIRGHGCMLKNKKTFNGGIEWLLVPYGICFVPSEAEVIQVVPKSILFFGGVSIRLVAPRQEQHLSLKPSIIVLRYR